MTSKSQQMKLSALPFRCNICTKRFRHLGQLNSHTRIHTGSKPFLCHVCKKSFRQIRHLQQHVRLHDREQYTCKSCNASFVQVAHLNLHMVRTHRQLNKRLRSADTKPSQLDIEHNQERFTGKLKIKLPTKNATEYLFPSCVSDGHLTQKGSTYVKCERKHSSSMAAKSCSGFKRGQEKSSLWRHKEDKHRVPYTNIKERTYDKGCSRKVPKVKGSLMSMPIVKVERVDLAMPKLERQEIPVSRHKDSPRRTKSPSCSPRRIRHLDSPRTYRTEPLDSTGSTGLKLKLTSDSPRALRKSDSPRTPDSGTGIKLKLKLNYKPCTCREGPKTNCTCSKDMEAPFTASIIESPQMDEVESASSSDEEVFPLASPSQLERNNNDPHVMIKSKFHHHESFKTDEDTVSDLEMDTDEELDEGDMPDDLSRHSPEECRDLADSISIDSEGPPSLTRIPSVELENPPMLSKVCCTGVRCHHRLRDLSGINMDCPCSPKVTGISPQYMVREEATSVGHGSPPSDVETNKSAQTPNGQYMSLFEEDKQGSGVSPKSQSSSPKSQSASPKLQSASPKSQSASPKSHSTSPKLPSESQFTSQKPDQALHPKPMSTRTGSSGFFDVFANFIKQKEQEIMMDFDDEDDDATEVEEVDKDIPSSMSAKRTFGDVGMSQPLVEWNRCEVTPETDNHTPKRGAHSGKNKDRRKFEIVLDVKKKRRHKAKYGSHLKERRKIEPVASTSQVGESPSHDKESKAGRHNLRRVRRQKHFSDFDYDYSLDDTDHAEEPYTDISPAFKRKPFTDAEYKRHHPSKRMPKSQNGNLLAKQWEKVFYLRHLLCELIAVVFPKLVYPPRFHKDTHAVEALVQQIIAALTDKEVVSSLQRSGDRASWFGARVSLCKRPYECLLHLRRRTMHLLKLLLPGLKMSSTFDRNSRQVDKLVREVISRNREARNGHRLEKEAVSCRKEVHYSWQNVKEAVACKKEVHNTWRNAKEAVSYKKEVHNTCQNAKEAVSYKKEVHNSWRNTKEAVSCKKEVENNQQFDNFIKEAIPYKQEVKLTS